MIVLYSGTAVFATALALLISAAFGGEGADAWSAAVALTAVVGFELVLLLNGPGEESSGDAVRMLSPPPRSDVDSAFLGSGLFAPSMVALAVLVLAVGPAYYNRPELLFSDPTPLADAPILAVASVPDFALGSAGSLRYKSVLDAVISETLADELGEKKVHVVRDLSDWRWHPESLELRKPLYVQLDSGENVLLMLTVSRESPGDSSQSAYFFARGIDRAGRTIFAADPVSLRSCELGACDDPRKALSRTASQIASGMRLQKAAATP